MILEQELVPYKTSDLPPSPWLILSPHPDDETIGMGGTICLGKKQDTIIWVVEVTDGGKGGDPNIRKQESKEAAKKLGIDKIIWWDLPDRNLIKFKSIFKKNFLQTISKLKPKTIFLPSCFEFHPDHRATTHMALSSLKQSKIKLTVWLYEISRQGEINKLIDITHVIQNKIEAINCYKSQIKQINYPELAISLNKGRSYTLPEHVNFAEGFWELTSYNLYEIKSHCKKYLYFPKKQSKFFTLIKGIFFAGKSL